METCFAAMTALNKSAGQAGREVLAAMNALNKSAGQAVERCFAAMAALNMGAGQAGRNVVRGTRSGAGAIGWPPRRVCRSWELEGLTPSRPPRR